VHFISNNNACITQLVGGRRFYAAEAAAAATSKSGKLVLNLVAPHTVQKPLAHLPFTIMHKQIIQALFESTEVERVDIPSTAGDMGILANHVPTIQQLRPGVIDVTLADGKSKKLFGILNYADIC
jgi:F-type H+-transporting ATPase subunit delta